MVFVGYNRQLALEYAKVWAYKRNDKYYNFDELGGDCTSFVSQCIYAGAPQMNYTPIFGWYYKNLNNRSPSWAGVEFLYNFLINNKSLGPTGILSSANNVQIGDIIQLGDEYENFYHTLIITSIDNGVIKVGSHTNDAFNRPLNTYSYASIRFVHITGFYREN